MPEDASLSSSVSPARFRTPSHDPARDAPVSASASPHAAALDDLTPPPAGGWHRLIWSIILLIGLVSAVGTVLLVYFLALQTF